jgi:hypothetical protein
MNHSGSEDLVLRARTTSSSLDAIAHDGGDGAVSRLRCLRQAAVHPAAYLCGRTKMLRQERPRQFRFRQSAQQRRDVRQVHARATQQGCHCQCRCHQLRTGLQEQHTDITMRAKTSQSEIMLQQQPRASFREYVADLGQRC